MGDLRQIILGHEERRDYPLRSHEGREAQWHVAQITVTDPSTGTIYEFPIRKWIDINNRGDIFECADKKEDTIAQKRHRQLLKYQIYVHTGDVSGAGTDANVSIILYGTLGDTGTRALKQKGKNLFERKQIDEFTIECLDLGKQRKSIYFLIKILYFFSLSSYKLGELTKLHIEHDNSGLLSADWFLDRVEVVNTETNERTIFPCERWLGKKHDDHEIKRDLLPIHAS